MLRIYQGEHELVDDNDLIGTFVFSGLQSAQAGAVGLKVTFDLNAEGELHVSAHDPGSEDHVQARIKFDPMGRQTKPMPKTRTRRPMAQHTGRRCTDGRLLPPSPFAGSLKLQPTFAESIDGRTTQEAVADLFDDLDMDLDTDSTPPPSSGWLSRLGQSLFAAEMIADLSHITVVLVRPQQPGNIGVAARAIANHGIGRLALVAPLLDPERARWMAPKSHHVIDNAHYCETVEEAVATIAVGGGHDRPSAHAHLARVDAEEIGVKIAGTLHRLQSCLARG